MPIPFFQCVVLGGHRFHSGNSAVLIKQQMLCQMHIKVDAVLIIGIIDIVDKSCGIYDDLIDINALRLEYFPCPLVTQFFISDFSDIVGCKLFDIDHTSSDLLQKRAFAHIPAPLNSFFVFHSAFLLYFKDCRMNILARISKSK